MPKRKPLPSPLHADEAEFLPAALEIMETPPSPVGRGILWTILACVAFSVAWACLGTTDVVAVATAKVIPSGQVKTIQLFEIGVVRRIAVEEGQHVVQGDLLVEMDTTASQADVERLAHELQQAECEKERTRALLRWSPRTATPPAFTPPEGLPEATAETYRRRVAEEAATLTAKLTGLDHEVERLSAQLRSVRASITKLEETLPIVSRRAESLHQLYLQRMGSEHDWLVREQERIETEQNLKMERQRLGEVTAAIRSKQDAIRQALAEFRQELLRQESESAAQSVQLAQDMVKARQRSTLQRVTAPVSGVVQQLSVHTVGGVIEGAQPIMVIVPDSYTLEVEARVLNKDIGFVREGQLAEVKLDAFPFTEYGALSGNVKHVSNDAVNDENLGLVYLTRVALERDCIRIGDKDIRLTPGMGATAEIKLRTRRIVSYFLSPLLKYTSESLRER